MKRAFAFSSALLMVIETGRARVLQDYPPTITPPPDPMAMELMRRDVNPSTITSYSAHMNLQYFQGWFTSDDEGEFEAGGQWSISLSISQHKQSTARPATNGQPPMGSEGVAQQQDRVQC